MTALLAPAPASAAMSPRVDFSADGHTWTASPDTLFRDAVLAPGAGTTASLWVRHHGSGDAQISVTALDEDLARWFSVQVNEAALAPAEAWLGPVLEPGDPFRMEFRVSLSTDAPLSIRDSTAHLLSHLSIRAIPGEAEEPGTPGTPSTDHGETDAEAVSPTGSTGEVTPSPGSEIGNRTPSALTVAGTPALLLLTPPLLLVLLGLAIRRRSRRG